MQERQTKLDIAKAQTLALSEEEARAKKHVVVLEEGLK